MFLTPRKRFWFWLARLEKFRMLGEKMEQRQIKKNVDEAGLCETSIRAEAHSLATSRGSERNFSRGYKGRYRAPKSYWALQAINQ